MQFLEKTKNYFGVDGLFFMLEQGDLNEFFIASLRYYQKNLLIACESDFEFLINRINFKLKDKHKDDITMKIYIQPLLEIHEKFMMFSKSKINLDYILIFFEILIDACLTTYNILFDK